MLLRLAGFTETDALTTLAGPEKAALLAELEEYAFTFLQVGRLSLRDWSRETDLERLAWVRAAKRSEIARVILEREHPAVSYADLDGGEAYRTLALYQQAQKAAERVAHGRA
jgi:hypothetical protein